MIAVTRLNGQEFVVNAGQIVFVESTPDTRLTLATGERCMVKEGVAEVVRRVEAFHRRCSPLLSQVLSPSKNEEVTSWTSQP